RALQQVLGAGLVSGEEPRHPAELRGGGADEPGELGVEQRAVPPGARDDDVGVLGHTPSTDERGERLSRCAGGVGYAGTSRSVRATAGATVTEATSASSGTSPVPSPSTSGTATARAPQTHRCSGPPASKNTHRWMLVLVMLRR